MVGARPVFVDIVPSTYNLDPALVEKAVTPRTRAILAVHLYGQPAAMDAIGDIARARGIAVVEDAAQAVGATYAGRPAGSWSDVACLSFYPTKNLGGCGDGGMVLTSRDDIAQAVRRLRDHGSPRKYEHVELGYSSRLDELQAALLRVKLRHLPALERDAPVHRRALPGAAPRRAARARRGSGAGASHLPPVHRAHAQARRRLVAALAEAGVGTAVHYPTPIPAQPMFAMPGRRSRLPPRDARRRPKSCRCRASRSSSREEIQDRRRHGEDGAAEARVTGPAAATELRQRLERRDATVGVVGLGYVGLPLAVAFAKAGLPVIGVDADAGRVERIGRGQSPVEDVPNDELAPLVRTGRLTVTRETAVLAAADAIIICVPTPLGKSKEPDISHIVAAADEVARNAPPRPARRPRVHDLSGHDGGSAAAPLRASGLAAGEQFFLAFSPERIDPGNRTWRLESIPKIVGGLTPVCRDLACALYGLVVSHVVPVTSPQAAELVKLFENIFRSVNIALANELAIMCRQLGLSVWEIIDAAATKPFGFMPFYPGPGIGGHCLPSDPYYLAWRARMKGYEARFIAFADEINGGMPAYTVQLAADALNDHAKPIRGSRILALGVAYKPGVGDVRDSPAIEIIEALLRRGAHVDYADPHVPSLTVGDRRIEAVDWAAADLLSYDLVAVLTAHREFDPARLIREARLVLDTRNLTGPLGAQPHVIRL